MKTTLIIFSGLPGTGKTTLARSVASKLSMPLFRIDDIVASIPDHMRKYANPFWDDMIGILLNLVEVQLELGISVIVDSVFMGEDRYQAYEIARRHKTSFRPIYTYLSDEKVWEERVRRRVETAPVEDEPARWDRIEEQRKYFYPWKPGSALFVDGIISVEANLDRIIEFITAPSVDLGPL